MKAMSTAVHNNKKQSQGLINGVVAVQCGNRWQAWGGDPGNNTGSKNPVLGQCLLAWESTRPVNQIAVKVIHHITGSINGINVLR